MAHSGSIKRAQAIKLCELCQEGSTKWRCIDCDMCLCEKCKTFHPRLPAMAQHQIVTIGTPLKEVQRKIVTDNIPCRDHPKKMVCLFCRSCDSLICPDCASSRHKKHDFIPIESAIEEKLASLRGIRDKVTTTLKSCESKNSEVQGIIPIYNAIFDESLTKIKQKEQELIDVIRKHSKDLQEKVENERSRINRTLSKIQQDVDKIKKILEDQRKELDAVLNSNQGSIIFNANMIIKDLQFESLPHQSEQFVPMTKSSDEIQKLFGSLQKISIPTTMTTRQPLPEIEVIRTFTTDLSFIEAVVTLDETTAWISCDFKRVVRKVNIQDNNMTTSQELSLKVYDMAVTSNNELLLNMLEGSDVKLVKRSGEMVNFLTVAPLIPRGIHVTKNNDIILGVKEDGNRLTEHSQTAVIVMDENGKEKQRYSHDEEGKRFTLPYRITTNYNQDIIVVDNISYCTGRVVVLNNGGKLRWVYEGHNETNASEQFDPQDIVTTTVGHIVVSDFSSHAIHVLSEDGEVLTCKVMRDMGVIYPWGLDFDNEGRLWLGCFTDNTDNTDMTDAKLHIIKFVY